MNPKDITIDGVRYWVVEDDYGDFVVRGYRRPRRSLELTFPPVTCQDNAEEGDLELDICEPEAIEIPAIQVQLYLHRQEVRQWAAQQGRDLSRLPELALELGIERLLRPRIEERKDPDLAARRREEQEVYDRIMPHQAKREQQLRDAKAEAARLERERKAREQEALESLPGFGLF